MGTGSVEPYVKTYFTKLKTEYLVLSVNKWCTKFGQSQYVCCLNIYFLQANQFLKLCVQIGLHLQDKSH